MTDSKRILLVDDDDDIRLVAGLSLRRVGGHDVEDVSSGAAALDALAASTFDLVMLDVQMPGMDGRATFDALRAAGNVDIPVIFLTASQQSEVTDLTDAGACGVLAKPFDPMTLATDVAAVMGWEHP